MVCKSKQESDMFKRKPKSESIRSKMKSLKKQVAEFEDEKNELSIVTCVRLRARIEDLDEDYAKLLRDLREKESRLTEIES
ncbi:5655_t:CDS:2, partial [Cetraspora pellucida]